MKSQTHHTNTFGTVTNPSSATGFRLEDDHGNWVEANIVEGKLSVEYGRPMSPSEQDFIKPLPLEYPEPPAKPIRTIAELLKATADMRPDHHCIWPDCGHDTNRVGHAVDCDGVGCPQRLAQGEKLTRAEAIAEWRESTTQPPHHDRGEWAIPELHGLSDAADYLARNPGDEYAQRRFRERMAQLTAALTEAKQQGPGEAFRHVANEWADMACNGLQWLRNIRDGLATVDDALVEMEANVKRIRALSEAEYAQRSAPQVEAKRQTGGDHG